MNRRFLADRAMTLACGACLFFTLLPLVSLLYLVISRGLPSLSLSFFTALPKPVGEVGGGVGNAIVGSAMMVGMAALMGLPAGIGAGIYLAENSEGRYAGAVRFLAEVLSSVPSVVAGLAIYALIVRPMHHFSALAGSVALAILIVPTLARTTEEVVKLVPRSLYEASLALGVAEWRSGLLVVARTALGGIATGACLALARAAGDTAPLLFTALSNSFWNFSPNQPTASLPVQIFNYAVSPYPDWQQKAWGAALVLLLFVGLLEGLARLISRYSIVRAT